MALDLNAFKAAISPAMSFKPGWWSGTEALLTACQDNGVTDLRQVAYVLATAYHETAFTMKPIEEYGKGRGRKYGIPNAKGLTYYGRGFVQLTWDYNYKNAGMLIGLDLLNKPWEALDQKTAALIAAMGMRDGWFTGKKLNQYFNAKVTDWNGARRIINGMDKAAEIGRHAKRFHAALLVASTDSLNAVPAPEPPATTPATSKTNAAATIIGLSSAATVASQVNELVGQATSVRDAGKGVYDLVTSLPSSPSFWLALAGVVILGLSGFIIYERIRKMNEQGV